MERPAPAEGVNPATVDRAYAQQLGLDALIHQQWIPLLHHDESSVPEEPEGVRHIAATASMTRRRLHALHTEHGERIHVHEVSSDELTSLLLEAFGEEIADDAAMALHRANPLASARTVFTRPQAIGLILALVITLVCLIVWPSAALGTLIAAAGIVFLCSTLFKFAVATRGAGSDITSFVSEPEPPAISDDDLPPYTVLVPVYREENIVAQLVHNLGGIDYPQHKLEVFILVEAEDDATRNAVLESNPPAHFHIMTVPDGMPRTKPRACNVGLRFARGEFLVIYDAEDTPEPDQLKKAVAAFRQADSSTVVLQAALNYFNARENMLTRMFTLEYNYWFYYMLPGLDAAGLPIPLGGTSNHFRTSALRELGGWDPHNVTEDADLGIRASALGYRVGVISSTTMEEANTSVPNFIRQRSRWIKGYMQTVLIHARRPAALMKEVGPVAFLSFLLLIGGTPATFLLVLPFMAVTAVAVLFPELIGPLDLPVWLLGLGMVNFFVGSALMVHLTMMGPYRRGTFTMVPWALLNPLYWVLHSIASYKALWQLLTRPHYWEKTAHGLTQETHADAEPAQEATHVS